MTSSIPIRFWFSLDRIAKVSIRYPMILYPNKIAKLSRDSDKQGLTVLLSYRDELVEFTKFLFV